MRAVGLKTLKNKLSEYVRLVAGGETVLVTDRDRVVAELGLVRKVPLPGRQRDERGSGGGLGRIFPGLLSRNRLLFWGEGEAGTGCDEQQHSSLRNNAPTAYGDAVI